MNSPCFRKSTAAGFVYSKQQAKALMPQALTSARPTAGAFHSFCILFCFCGFKISKELKWVSKIALDSPVRFPFSIFFFPSLLILAKIMPPALSVYWAQTFHNVLEELVHSPMAPVQIDWSGIQKQKHFFKSKF